MCDTLGVLKIKSENGKNLIGKNSDRPVGEAQPLVYIAGALHKNGETVRLTNMSLPQAEKTYSVIGSKPYWIWGFEMGINEYGLYIDNEAESSRNAETGEEGLLGMDMLRLALERSQTCREAISTITSLLKEYGQNANASMLFDRRYENTFMLMDKNEMWVLETAGREWAAKKITDYAAVSNCYSIGEGFDMSSENLVKTAIENGWQSPKETFDFAKAYTLPEQRQRCANARFYRMKALLSEKEKHNFESIKGILKDHMENTVENPRFSAEYGCFYTICMHPLTWKDAKTAASLLATYDDELGIVMRHAFSVPCSSVYMPVYFTGYLPECMQKGGEIFDENSLWWCVERMTVAICRNPEKYKEKAVLKLRATEKTIEAKRAQIEEQAKEHLAKGERKLCCDTLNSYMDESAFMIKKTANDIYGEIMQSLGENKNVYGACREMVMWYEEHCKM